MSTRGAREEYIREVGNCILQDRNADYGDPEDNFKDIAEFWSIQFERKLKAPFTAADVAVAMDHVKNSRIKTSPEKLDHWVDKGGYAGCGYGIVAKAEASKVGRVIVDHPVYGKVRGTFDPAAYDGDGYLRVTIDGTAYTCTVHKDTCTPVGAAS